MLQQQGSWTATWTCYPRRSLYLHRYTVPTGVVAAQLEHGAGHLSALEFFQTVISFYFTIINLNVDGLITAIVPPAPTTSCGSTHRADGCRPIW